MATNSKNHQILLKKGLKRPKNIYFWPKNGYFMSTFMPAFGGQKWAETGHLAINLGKNHIFINFLKHQKMQNPNKSGPKPMFKNKTGHKHTATWTLKYYKYYNLSVNLSQFLGSKFVILLLVLSPSL